MAQSPDGREPRRSYYVRNPWRTWSSAAFGGASAMLTVTTVFYALGRLPLVLVGVSVVLAVAVFGFGLYARIRAARFDAQIGSR
ncbi:hypothetical protein [Pseudoxanthomonas suwonensis]|uniref:hypothetical protein n=1 Tax=Pseudoxanthomonas suwonensis TaxID=314722 RepID=UPI00048A9D69|nr:hypothetical protein [Pseudoxanthomonas suwonensis]